MKRLAGPLPTVLLTLALCAGASPACAQTLSGRVLEDGGHSPVSGAAVVLFDRDGKKRAEALADSLGRFRLAPPEAGDYYLAAERVGYRTTRSPLLALKGTGTASLDLLMTPEPIALKGLEVEVEKEARDYLQSFGLSPARLGNRWIGREKIDSMKMPGGAADIIRWSGVPGVSVIQRRPTDPRICVVTEYRGSGKPCALVVLNGVVMSDSLNADVLVDSQEFESIAILGATEATTFFGTIGGAGAVLIWTRRGR